MEKPRIFLGSSGKQAKLLQALTRGLEDVARVDAQPVGDQRDFVDQGDVDVALGILQHLGEFGDANR